MAAIGQALGDLPDAAARQRVLKWAAERFAIENGDEAAVAVAPAAVSSSNDTDLAVDSLNDMFAAQVSVIDDDLGEFAAPAVVVASVPAPVETQKQPLEAVLRSFAAEFRAFADEWNGAAA